jgi:uncharacterized glyoxalase superfamily protein PhnB
MEPSRPTPANWSRLSSALYYEDAARAIDWLCQAFGFQVRLKIEGKNGQIEHSELTYGDAILMVGQSGRERPDRAFCKSPKELGGANTQSLMLYVDDADAHCARARAHGAVILAEPSDTDYGDEYWKDRGYEAVDLEGHHFWFYQRLRDPKAR